MLFKLYLINNKICLCLIIMKAAVFVHVAYTVQEVCITLVYQVMIVCRYSTKSVIVVVSITLTGRLLLKY